METVVPTSSPTVVSISDIEYFSPVVFVLVIVFVGVTLLVLWDTGWIDIEKLCTCRKFRKLYTSDDYDSDDDVLAWKKKAEIRIKSTKAARMRTREDKERAKEEAAHIKFMEQAYAKKMALEQKLKDEEEAKENLRIFRELEEQAVQREIKEWAKVLEKRFQDAEENLGSGLGLSCTEEGPDLHVIDIRDEEREFEREEFSRVPALSSSSCRPTVDKREEIRLQILADEKHAKEERDRKLALEQDILLEKLRLLDEEEEQARNAYEAEEEARFEQLRIAHEEKETARRRFKEERQRIQNEKDRQLAENERRKEEEALTISRAEEMAQKQKELAAQRIEEERLAKEEDERRQIELAELQLREERAIEINRTTHACVLKVFTQGCKLVAGERREQREMLVEDLLSMYRREKEEREDEECRVARIREMYRVVANEMSQSLVLSSTESMVRWRAEAVEMAAECAKREAKRREEEEKVRERALKKAQFLKEQERKRKLREEQEEEERLAKLIEEKTEREREERRRDFETRKKEAEIKYYRDMKCLLDKKKLAYSTSSNVIHEAIAGVVAKAEKEREKAFQLFEALASEKVKREAQGRSQENMRSRLISLAASKVAGDAIVSTLNSPGKKSIVHSGREGNKNNEDDGGDYCGYDDNGDNGDDGDDGEEEEVVVEEEDEEEEGVEKSALGLNLLFCNDEIGVCTEESLESFQLGSSSSDLEECYDQDMFTKEKAIQDIVAAASAIAASTSFSNHSINQSDERETVSNWDDPSVHLKIRGKRRRHHRSKKRLIRANFCNEESYNMPSSP